MVGDPEITQVKPSMFNPGGNVGEMEQLERVPVVVGVCVTACPIVSATVLGEKATVGLAMRMLRLTVAVPDPVLLVAVMV